ncbi:MAG: biotin--[acetyl-CoA-carboxylase] ligase [Chiayiivirga sp.]|jgi:BirA family biotin operon repressor/biotin-[acetyl-CoA-carboxylase] ligase|uniref:biotin--[acetyl-CoA-carboxylase] ligase n=1 Tax=Chiayiivirga sp. TaxID=2041042 RepID=UPI0025BC7907|nr:biotin--[acetyl-CoA-carboxylase] ligase [Chiayiivirga sp.]MCI1710809.1 biotin--[acetyl-CoA-carboxylase] ligase [Chiayiivirga sp.]MCI1728350.1 biotin--[acetyl-CoA-carboxylase] ligase [Chiayiivirga sp.]
MSLDARDAMALRVALPAAMVARIGRIDCVAQVDSTNAELLRRGAAQPDLAVLLADAQSAGRGRRGRHWQSPPGANLYASLYWRHRREAQALGGLSVVVGLACAEALQALGIAAVRVKWPNDLIAQGRKLGGVLIELAAEAAVIGIGLNLHMPEATAERIDQPWTDLITLGVDVERPALMAALLLHLIPALDDFLDHGLEPFHARWQALDAFAGARVHAFVGDERLEGEALGLAPDGGLRLRLEHGERVLHSADVSLRAA